MLHFIHVPTHMHAHTQAGRLRTLFLPVGGALVGGVVGSVVGGGPVGAFIGIKFGALTAAAGTSRGEGHTHKYSHISHTQREQLVPLEVLTLATRGNKNSQERMRKKILKRTNNQPVYILHTTQLHALYMY